MQIGHTNGRKCVSSLHFNCFLKVILLLCLSVSVCLSVQLSLTETDRDRQCLCLCLSVSVRLSFSLCLCFLLISCPREKLPGALVALLRVSRSCAFDLWSIQRQASTKWSVRRQARTKQQRVLSVWRQSQSKTTGVFSQFGASNQLASTTATATTTTTTTTKALLLVLLLLLLLLRPRTYFVLYLFSAYSVSSFSNRINCHEWHISILS